MSQPIPDPDKSAFEAEAASSRQSLAGEFLDFLKHNKKWWLLPIIIVVLLFGVIVILGSTPLGSFIYPLI